MQHSDQILSAGLCLLLSLADRTLCSQHHLLQEAEHAEHAEHRPAATSYSYFSMALPGLHAHAAHAAHAPEQHTLEEDYYSGEDDDVYHESHPKYEFKYGVEDHHTGDYKDAKEERDGDVVRGEYSLLQPDGRKRTVHYTASKHGGFNAIVSYSGHAIHPEDPHQHEYTETEPYVL